MLVMVQELRRGKCHQPESRNQGADCQDPPAGLVLIGMQFALLPGKEGVTEKSHSEENDADNEGDYCHVKRIYSL